MSKKVLALLLCVFLFLMTVSVSAQELVSVTAHINLRSQPNRSSEIVRLLQPGDQITILESVTGSTVWLNGQQSSLWYRVALADGTGGYVWSGLIDSRPTLTNDISTPSPVDNPDPVRYPVFVCQTCNYQTLSINEMSWRGSVRRSQPITNYLAVFNLVYSLPARDAWIGYDAGGYDMPEDVQQRYTLRFTVATNILSGPLRYQGQLYDQLVLTDDQIEIWFLYSPSTGEGFVFPFRSLTPTETASGEHLGSHLWGAYGVPWTAIEALDLIIQAGI